MFDALEHKWRKEPGHATLIQDLYKGTMQDWLKCLKCQTERIKEDAFLDLPLAVRPFGATEAHKSVVRFEEGVVASQLALKGGGLRGPGVEQTMERSNMLGVVEWSSSFAWSERWSS